MTYPQPPFKLVGFRSMECTICGTRGMAGSNPPYARACIENIDHPFVCTCKRRYPSRIALAAHVKARNIRWPDGQQHSLADVGESNPRTRGAHPG